MRSSISFENSNEITNSKAKFLLEINNDQSPVLNCDELKQIKRKNSNHLQELNEKPKLKRKTKSFDPNWKDASSIYGSIFNDSNSNHLDINGSNLNLSFFDSNSNFSEKKIENLKKAEQKKDSFDVWASKESKILEKLGNNKSQGKKFTLNFNDSSLFVNSN